MFFPDSGMTVPVSNFMLNECLEDLARAHGTAKQTVLDELSKVLEQRAPSPGDVKGLIFNEERGAFEASRGERPLGDWADGAVRSWFIEKAARTASCSDELASSLLEGDAENLGLIVVGYATSSEEMTWDEFERLRREVAALAEQTGRAVSCFPSRELDYWEQDEQKIGVLIGQVVAACSSTEFPAGPFVLGRTTEIEESLPSVLGDLDAESGCYVVAKGDYASAYALTGKMEARPTERIGGGWPELYRSPDCHAQFGAGAQQPSFIIRGRHLAAAGAAKRYSRIAQRDLDEPIAVQLRTFEDEETVGRERQLLDGVSYDSLNDVVAPSAPTAPHVHFRTVAHKTPKKSAISRLLSPFKRSEDPVALLDRTESFLSECLPQTLEEAGLNPGASSDERLRLAKAVGLAELPTTLDLLLAWHDGQCGSGSIFPDGGDWGGLSLVSTEDALHWLELSKELQNWEDSYVPVLENGAGDCLCVDTARGGQIVSWLHEEPDESRVVAKSLQRVLEDGLADWPDYFESFLWSNVRFELLTTTLEEVAPAVLNWSRLICLRPGALLVSEDEGGARAMLHAGLDDEGGAIWVTADAASREELWSALSRSVNGPLYPGREESDYEEGILGSDASQLVGQGEKLFFGYVKITRD